MSLSVPSSTQQSPNQQPKLLDQVREIARAKGHSEASANGFVEASRQFILFHHKKHPKAMGRAEIGQYLTHVAQNARIPLVAVEANRKALDFLYREVLHMAIDELPWPRQPRLLDQVRQVLRVKHYSPRTEDCYA